MLPISLPSSFILIASSISRKLIKKQEYIRDLAMLWYLILYWIITSKSRQVNLRKVLSNELSTQIQLEVMKLNHRTFQELATTLTKFVWSSQKRRHTNFLCQHWWQSFKCAGAIFWRSGWKERDLRIFLFRFLSSFPLCQCC